MGDFVKLEQENLSSKQAFISEILKRKSFIPRPKVANVDQIVIVSSIKEPELDFEQLNRYLCFCEFYKIKPILLFNKSDLSFDDDVIEKVFSIYEPLNYEIYFASATEKTGLDSFKNVLKDKTTAFCGASGVGKTTLINDFAPNLNLRTKTVSEKKLRGTHTTRHCEIIDIKFEKNTFRLVDTPGFLHLKFDFLLPQNVFELFKEFLPYKNKCKFKDCLHLNEIDCAILKNIEKFNISRYESYSKFVSEAKEFKEKIKFEGDKKEETFKISHDKKFAKISTRKREFSRKKLKQEVKKIDDET